MHNDMSIALALTLLMLWAAIFVILLGSYTALDGWRERRRFLAALKRARL
jgi:hypothetical protein